MKTPRWKELYTLEEVVLQPLNPRMKTGDATGEKHNRLTVLGYAGSLEWWCQCDCGHVIRLWIGRVRTGQTQSCGCLRSEKTIERNIENAIHGYTGHPLMNTWNGIKLRCLNPKAINYERYGGRGIKIYQPWLDDDPVAFCDWIDQNLGPRPANHTLDRIDNDGNYEPGNLRWATRLQQNRNRRK